jgi:hypothetical protein
MSCRRVGNGGTDPSNQFAKILLRILTSSFNRQLWTTLSRGTDFNNNNIHKKCEVSSSEMGLSSIMVWPSYSGSRKDAGSNSMGDREMNTLISMAQFCVYFGPLVFKGTSISRNNKSWPISSYYPSLHMQPAIFFRLRGIQACLITILTTWISLISKNQSINHHIWL